MKKSQLNLKNSIAFIIVVIFTLIIGILFLMYPIKKSPSTFLYASNLSFLGQAKKISLPESQKGLEGWSINRNGQNFLAYSVTGSPYVFLGAVYDARTGTMVSSSTLLQNQKRQQRQVPQSYPSSLPQTENRSQNISQSSIQQMPAGIAAMDGVYTDEVPDALKLIDSLVGIKEGSGAIGDTVYIIFDPRCSYCSIVYKKSRAYIAAGFTIKWIPVVALGNEKEGNSIIASILQSDDPLITLKSVMERSGFTKMEPSEQTIAQLTDNLAFLFAVFEQNADQGRAGVPVAFFMDHRTKQPRMILGLSEDVVLADIFGEVK